MIAAAVLPEAPWDTNDDACDCMYERIGFWANPYLGETLEVRMCCIWDELYKLFPGKMRKTDAFLNYNTGEWEPAREWDGETDMPKALWYRQLARQTGRTVASIREEYRDRDDERPKGTPRPVVETPPAPDVAEVLFEMVTGLAEELARLRALVEPRTAGAPVTVEWNT